MSRIAVPILLSFLLFTLAIPPASATTITIGDIFSETEVTTSIMINDAIDVATVRVAVTYDPSVIVVTAADVEAGDFEVFYDPEIDNERGWTLVGAYQMAEEGLSGNVKLAELTIAPVGSYGEISTLNLTVVELTDSDFEDIDAEDIDGSFTVKSSGGSGGNGGSGGSRSTPTPSPSPSPTPPANETITPSPSPSQPEELTIITVLVGEVTVERGELASITILINGVGGEGLSSALIDLTYNPKIVKVVSAGNSDFDMFEPNIVDGQVRMIGVQTGAEGLKGDILFAELQVKAVGKVNESSELALEVKELTDNVGQGLKESKDFEVENGWVSIKGEEGSESEQSKPFIPTLGVVETIAVITGLYLVIRLRRRK